MRETGIPEDQRLVREQIANARGRVEALEARRCELAADLAERDEQRRQYAVLSDVCGSLEQLDGLGAAHLFWGAQAASGQAAEHLAGLRRAIDGFEAEVAAVQARQADLQRQIDAELAGIGLLTDELLELQAEHELRREEYVVEREYVPAPYRPVVMPWNREGDDDRRLRKALAAALLVSLSFTFLVSRWTVAPPSTDVVEIPERLARLVRQEPPPAPPVERREEPRPEEPKPDQPEVAERPPEQRQPTVAERQAARETAETAGLLAFRDTFAEMQESAPQARLGVEARVTDAGRKATGQAAQRAVLTAQTQGGSGGIATESLRREVAASGTQGVAVEFSRVESAIGTELARADRPLSDGPRPSRTDEEIQIVFDRYKATLYRIYNRELRRDPTLRGKMILRITIEPDGSVSNCSVESTDLQSPALVSEIVERVSRFNFGPKEGVPSITILYPIDFLPAN